MSGNTILRIVQNESGFGAKTTMKIASKLFHLMWFFEIQFGIGFFLISSPLNVSISYKIYSSKNGYLRQTKADKSVVCIIAWWNCDMCWIFHWATVSLPLQLICLCVYVCCKIRISLQKPVNFCSTQFSFVIVSCLFCFHFFHQLFHCNA